MSLISLDSIIKINKKYYPQTLLQECVCKLINRKVENIITNNIQVANLLMNQIMNK